MNNDYMNEEMEIDLIELLKHLLRNIKTILIRRNKFGWG